MKQQFEVKYTPFGMQFIEFGNSKYFFEREDLQYMDSTHPDKVFIEMLHSNGDFDYPKKYIPKLQNGCVILIMDEVEQDGMDCKVVMLPRECKTLMKNDLYKIADHVSGDKLFMIDRTTSLCNLWQPQHLYVTSNEQIKEGDWCMYNDGGSKDIRKAIRCYNGRVYFSETTFAKKELLIKIIACTDLSLPLPSIPISWIKDVYVASNGKIDNVKLVVSRFYNSAEDLLNETVSSKLKLLPNNEVIIVQDEVEKEYSLLDECDKPPHTTPTQEQSDISLDAAELKKAIQLKNEGWADSLEFKIWSLAYENNSEDNYRSVIAEVEKLQPKIIEQIDVDKAALAYAHEHPALRGVIRAFKAGSSWQQSHPPVTSMSAEEFYNQEMGHLSIIKPTVVINALTKYASYVLANSDRWSDEQLLQLCLDFKGYTTGNESIQYIDLYGTPYKEQLQNFLTKYKQK